MERLWNVFDLFTEFVNKSTKSKYCGCVRRGDGQYLTYCQQHNKRTGTHGRVGGVAPPKELS